MSHKNQHPQQICHKMENVLENREKCSSSNSNSRVPFPRVEGYQKREGPFGKDFLCLKKMSLSIGGLRVIEKVYWMG